MASLKWTAPFAATSLLVAVVLVVLYPTPERDVLASREDCTGQDNTLSRDNIRDNLRFVTEFPHGAGSPGDERIASWIEQKWTAQGLDSVKTYWYNTLLSFPDKEDPSTITLEDNEGKTLFTSQVFEPHLTPGGNPQEGEQMPPFSAFSPSGDVQGDLIYVNYGRVEDFKLLRDEYKINFTGRIVLARYGYMFRGAKVVAASDFGAAGILLYFDPADSMPDPSYEKVYPNDWWLPRTGIQQGSILSHGGERQTPGYPAIDSAYRIPEDKLDLPKIPCHCISYGDASTLFSALSGPLVPEGWAGAIPEVTYRIGPQSLESGLKVRLRVRTHNKVVKTSNIVGSFKGSVEPDRYVLVGVHRDAWEYGAMDPGIAVAIQMEMVRAMSTRVSQGWRPRRTILFCSWGAEEYGLMGSMEWVENFLPILRGRTVAYLNLDVAVMGNFTIQAAGLPLLHDVMYEAARKVESPNSPGQTLYEEWLHRSPKKTQDGRNLRVPKIFPLGSGSNFDPFINLVGVPSMDVSYLPPEDVGVHVYSLYHSVYDSFYAVDNFLDPEYKYSQTLGSYMTQLLLPLSDDQVLPMNAATYAHEIRGIVDDFDEKYHAHLSKQGISLTSLKSAVTELNLVASSFMKYISHMDRQNAYAVRAVNDQLMLMERAFIDPGGLPRRPQYKNVLYAPSTQDLYTAATLPGMDDLLFHIEDAEDAEERWESVRRHLASITYTVEVAISALRSPIDL